MGTRAEYIAGRIVHHYRRRKKFEDAFQFPKGTKLATKEEVIRLLKTQNIDAEFNQVFNERTEELSKDTSVILIGRPMQV